MTALYPDHIKTICVYCGSSAHVGQTYTDLAVSVAEHLVKNGKAIVYGGGKVGLMGKVAESGINAGGTVIGIIPEYLVYKELQHESLSEMHVVDSMHTRKRMMVERSDAFLILPGGFGTLDEAFEIMTWRQLGLHEKPIVFLNHNEFWTPLVDLIDHIAREKFSGAESRNLFTVAATIDDVPAAMARAPSNPQDPRTKWM